MQSERTYSFVGLMIPTLKIVIQLCREERKSFTENWVPERHLEKQNVGKLKFVNG